MGDDLRDRGPQPIHEVPGGARPLVGCADELRSLTAALAAVTAGRGRAVAVVGEPGIGKSSLLAATAVQARAAGVPVRTARGRNAATAAPANARRTSGIPDLAQRSGEGTPLLVTVDDLHDVTAEDLAAVDDLLHAASTGPVFCLLAYRPRQLSLAQADMVSRAAAAGILEEWTLPPLSPEQAGEPLGGEHPHADDALNAAMGNPLYLKALSHAEEARAQAGAAILGELAGLDADALAVMNAAAVLGEPFPPDLVAAVADLDEAAAIRALDHLTRRDLLRSIEAPLLGLRHRTVGEVVHQRLTPGGWIALHRRAESALARRTAPLVSRARHVARAADPNQPEHVTTLIAAARSVLYGSPAEAAGYLRAAVPLLRESQEHWYEAHVLLARAQLLAGDTSESRELLDTLRSTVNRTLGVANRAGLTRTMMVKAGRLGPPPEAR